MDILEKIQNYIQKGNIEKAYELIKKHENMYISNYKYWNLRGILCMYAQEYATAIECLKKAIELNPLDGESYYNLGYSYESLAFESDAAVAYGLSYRYIEDKIVKQDIEKLFVNKKEANKLFNRVAKEKKKRFIILSSCGWGEILQRMHHIARALAKMGNDVSYITPSVEATTSSESITIEEMNKYTFENIREVDGVKIFAPIIVKNTQHIIGGNYTQLVQDILDDKKSEETVIITYLPGHANTIKNLKGKFAHIYECVDDHTDLQYAFWGCKQDVMWEQELMDSADAITTTAMSLYLEKTRAEKRKNVYISPNAVNEIDFYQEPNLKIPLDLERIPEPRILYVGVVYDRFDEGLFYSVVESNPDKSFVIIGEVKNGLLTRKYKNLYALGIKSHNDLKSYMAYSQIGIIPYVEQADMDVACDSIKCYEYIACGLPVITTYMPECMVGKINTFYARTRDEFNISIVKSLKMKIDKTDINKFMMKNSWYNRAQLLCEIVDYKSNKEKKEDNNYIRNNIEQVLIENKYEILLSLYSQTLEKNEIEKSIEYSKEGYSKLSSKYTEKIYLRNLLEKNYKEEMKNVVINSNNIEASLKAQYLYYELNKEIKNANILLNIIVENNRYLSILMKNINKEIDKVLIAYIYMKIGEYEEAIAIFKNIKDKVELKSPLYQYLYTILIAIDISKEEYFSNYKMYLSMEEHYEIINKTSYKHIEETYNEKYSLISIIIPTRNSAEVLKGTIETCIEQEYSNYEIIISDNSDEENLETYKLVEKFKINKENSNKIKYHKTNGGLSMQENFENGYNLSKGEYLIFLGSDDGLLFHSLKYLGEIIKKYPEDKIFHWNPIAFGYPGISLKYYQDKILIPNTAMNKEIKLFDINCKEAIESLLKFEIRYSNLPMAYYNSLIKKSVLDELKSRVGKVFAGISPDVFTAMAICALSKTYKQIDMPLSIGGDSKVSNGMANLFTSNGTRQTMDRIKKQEFVVKLEQQGLKKSKYSTNIPSEESCIIDELEILIQLGLYQDTMLNQVDWKKYLEKNIYYVSKLDSDNVFKEKMQSIYEKTRIHDNAELKSWFGKNYYYNKEFRGIDEEKIIMPIGFSINNDLCLEASKFNVNNAYGVAKLFKNIYGI